MKTITQSQNVTLSITKDDLIDSAWIPTQRVSALLSQKEKEDNTAYKTLRVKFYNTTAGGKFNIKNIAGMKCINVKKPMQEGVPASIVIHFIMEK